MISSAQLRYRYGGETTLQFPDIEIPQGGTLLLRGPSGSGKSTWLALVAGLLKPLAGQLLIAGQDVVALHGSAADRWRARAIGFLPQKLHLSDALTVTGNLAMAQWAAGVPHDATRIVQILGDLDVAALAQRRPGELSGGQAQRVALARAVLLNPRVLLADEPTASLDDLAADKAIALLRQCASGNNATLVIATHDSRLVRALPDVIQINLTNC